MAYYGHTSDLFDPKVIADVRSWTASDYLAAAAFTPWTDTASDIQKDTDKLRNAWNILGYAEGGIADGPESGYWAKLHGRERIIPTSGKGNDDLVNELKALRQEVAALKAYNYQIVKNTAKSYDINDKWDSEGIPPERAA